MTSIIGAPIPVTSDEPIPHDLICSICMSLPTEVPVITPCQHLFCKECLREALSRQQLCPVDRCAVYHHQVTELQNGSLARRIWASVRVKCANHAHGCAWIGPIEDYRSHATDCIHDQEGTGEMQRRLEVIEEEMRQLRQLNTDLVEQIQQGIQLNQEKEEKLRRAAERDPRAIGLFDGSYNFGRANVVQLSQLISSRLENQPSYINTNRIFNCVQACFRDWEAGYRDNPKHYQVDMKMLLATCHASTWFSDNQRGQIQTMMNKLFY